MNQPRLLGGRYQLGELLGYGGMAEVHRGRDQRLGRDVAVKVLRADLARDPGFQERFRREAQNAAALNHPAIVAVYDTGEEETPEGALPYIVMEYVDGQTLKEVLAQDGRIMPERALEIVADVCAALDFSHRHGIVHRDIKPANVMLTPNGAVKVMDFGIARAMTSATAAMTQTSAVIGTAQYLSPEQARGESVDARSDVYSTGCLLYELLVGHPPFSGDNPVSVAYQHVREDPIPPGELDADIAPVIDAVVLKSMAKNPVNRYQSAGEMRIDLLRAAAGRPVSAPAVMSTQERTAILPGGTREADPLPPDSYDQENSRKKKALITTLVVLGVILLLGIAAFATAQLLGDKTPKVAVPNVVGNNVNVARNELENKSFTVSVRRVKSSKDNKDKVVTQSPDSGQAAKGSEIKLEVGNGPVEATVPNLDGLSQDEAEQRLRSAGLTPVFSQTDSSKDAGTVVSYSPGAGTKIAKGDSVNVEISKGNLVSVPDVVGQDIEAATQTLESAGFKVMARDDTGSSQPKNTVTSQSIKAKEEKPSGTTIILGVATDGSSPTPSDSGEPTTPGPTFSEPSLPTN